MSNSPNLTRPALAVTDGAEVTVTVISACQAVYVSENPGASGWPRAFLVRLTGPGSQQQQVAPGTQYAIPGPFQPGDIAGKLELVSAGGDSSTFNVTEMMR